MTLSEYQEHVSKTYRGESYDRLVASLAEELGEIAQVIKGIRNEGFTPRLESALILELGDLIRYAVMLAVRAQIPIDEIITSNTKKIEARYPKCFRTDVHNQKQEIADIVTN